MSSPGFARQITWGSQLHLNDASSAERAKFARGPPPAVLCGIVSAARRRATTEVLALVTACAFIGLPAPRCRHRRSACCTVYQWQPRCRSSSTRPEPKLACRQIVSSDAKTFTEKTPEFLTWLSGYQDGIFAVSAIDHRLAGLGRASHGATGGDAVTNVFSMAADMIVEPQINLRAPPE